MTCSIEYPPASHTRLFHTQILKFLMIWSSVWSIKKSDSSYFLGRFHMKKLEFIPTIDKIYILPPLVLLAILIHFLSVLRKTFGHYMRKFQVAVHEWWYMDKRSFFVCQSMLIYSTGKTWYMPSAVRVWWLPEQIGAVHGQTLVPSRSEYNGCFNRQTRSINKRLFS